MASVEFQIWLYRTERHRRRFLAVETRKHAWGQCRRRPRWRWHLFQASLWAAWRLRRAWSTRLAEWVCTVRFTGWDYPGSARPIEWPKWMKREEEVPW